MMGYKIIKTSNLSDQFKIFTFIDDDLTQSPNQYIYGLKWLILGRLRDNGYKIVH